MLYREDEGDLYCPCHNGYFTPVNGAPTAGPPERPLPEILLERRGSAIVAVGEGRVAPGEAGPEDQAGA